MTNIASALKAEIARVARKEIRAEIEGLKNVRCQVLSADMRRAKGLVGQSVRPDSDRGLLLPLSRLGAT